MKKLVDIIKKYIVLISLSVPALLAYLSMRVLLWISIIQCNITSKNKVELKPFQNRRMVEVKSLSKEEKIDFKKHRSKTYITQLVFGSLWELSKLAGNQQIVPLISDDVLYRVLHNGVFSYGLSRSENGHSDVEWTMHFDIDSYNLFQGFYWDVTEIKLHENQTLSITDRMGRLHKPGSKNWNLAKAHAQAQLGFFGPGLTHDNVHFVFPSIMAAQIRLILPKSSVLRQLVEPHTRFTQYINHKALFEGQSTSNTGSLVDKLFRPWLSFPINNNDFINGLQKRCEVFYYDKQQLAPDMEQELPYHIFLASYRRVIREYVTQLAPLLKDDFDILLPHVAIHLPAIKQYEMIDVVTILLWKSAVVHFCDHYTYLEQFAYKYGCIAMRKPLVGYVENPNTISEVMPYFHPEDVYRSRCFFNCFVRYNANPDLDLGLSSTRYEFTSDHAKQCAETFQRNLGDLDNQLQKSGKAMVPLDKIIRSVCF
ncbi:unnamed protein product [Clavelina lepadiformis]|uniref:Uncharacterized protein n=2 Tax=Clavelina lepadiformis TaxID=159417 RepID=A0ABP0FFY7_CLALP